MPGDIFVFIARAGSCLQVLIIDRSSSTREPVCEAPSAPPGSHYHIPGPSLQLGMSCLGWTWWHRWCHLQQALPAGAIPGSWEVICGRGKPKSICTYTRLPRLMNTFGCSHTLPRGWWTCRPLRRPVQPWTWPSLSVGKKKSFIILLKNRAAWFPRFYSACRPACLTHNSISCPMRGSPMRDWALPRWKSCRDFLWQHSMCQTRWWQVGFKHKWWNPEYNPGFFTPDGYQIKKPNFWLSSALSVPKQEAFTIHFLIKI